MDSKNAIKAAMDLSSMVYRGYLSDLDDAEMLQRPSDGCNHFAWQTGHLIASEVGLLESICPGKAATLPDGFEEAHAKEAAASDDASQFKSRDEYMQLWDSVRASTVAALDGLSAEDLDAESPEHMRDFCPTVGHMFVLIGTHPMMHAGQAVPLRRKTGKPVMF
ncbi:DinB family protein [Planctomycetes bacterium K23_9]|uniref:DinB superfamily protein n=1 Tax=Stieleria marina TaxID=1930275 RepID=A0A517NQX3_9BACT|nr:DinB superfamily protein [Planctomycetes bacterium K23_9]